MAKISFYYMTNICKNNEFTYFETLMTESKLCKMVNLTSINSFIDDKMKNEKKRENVSFEVQIDNLDYNIENSDNMDFNPENLVDTLLDLKFNI
ncbi:9183_t:CDS:2 [Cetraspora pellucida]|uniref:9183_t:CDS:1 n=1 Tax=Cetraspora pellucida TaxID=1433469 RepID=A0A9N9EHE2_9GLOM|nr:9183_t:CDS:2 [Cetraspora pellucida]